MIRFGTFSYTGTKFKSKAHALYVNVNSDSAREIYTISTEDILLIRHCITITSLFIDS